MLFCRGSEFSGELGNGGALNEEQPAPTPVDTTGAIYPVVGGWDGDGTDTVGVKAGTTWSLNTPTTPAPPTSP